MNEGVTERRYGCKVGVENLKNCALHPENVCEPPFLVNCFICGENINCDICGMWSEWDERGRQVKVIKKICGRIKEV